MPIHSLVGACFQTAPCSLILPGTVGTDDDDADATKFAYMHA